MISQNIYRLLFRLDLKPEPAPSHEGWQEYALDFAMPEGTPILAAKGGLVHEVKDSSSVGGPDKTLADRCNSIIIKHSHGEYSDYVHLKSGILVREGQRVRKGQLIGYSGNTGYTTYPHLHFDVFRWDGDEMQTIIPRFKKGDTIYTLRSS